MAFALLLASLLALPAVVAETGWLDRRDVYPAVPWDSAPSSFIQRQIFGETGDADMVFLGSSHIWASVDTPYVQKKLSEKLGRNATVFTLGWAWPGFDAVYVIGRDLLEHRRVHTLVIYDDGRDDSPHPLSNYWFVMGENSEALSGLSPVAQLSLYGGAILGMPRQLLSLVRPNPMEDPGHARPNIWSTGYRTPNLAQNLGALRVRLAYGFKKDFVPFQPRGGATEADVLVYSAETRDRFEFSGRPARPVSAYQFHFVRKLAQLCRERRTQLVILKIPVLDETGDRVSVAAPELNPEIPGAHPEIVGIPPAKLFAGISAADAPKLFYDVSHLNQNGQDFFTPLITPALLKLYDIPSTQQ